MKFSIITVNYNNKDGLQRTIESVIHQSYRDFEFIIIDGGSTDGSAELLKTYNNHITYWVSEKDNGIYNAMNKGIRKARGEYLNFMNSGDCFYNETVLEQLSTKYLSSDIIIGKDYHFNKKKQQGFATHLPSRLSMLTFIHHTLPHQSTFFKKKLFDNSPYDESLKLVADVKFYIQKICVEQCSVQLIDSIICLREPDGISKVDNERRLQEHRLIVEEVLPPGAIKDYETLYLLDKSSMYKLMHIIEQPRSRKWLTYAIKFIYRLNK
ncbi:Glycosyl transferase family 2 [Xylanibacter ruminicola]|uniref:Glycosyl transferase family 2 n=1 Tax=Xylanibacter ruminicola TaxID=839 RepID=A0A1H4F1Y6_XYLRU|nr:glycosyltransferase family 2 protein [Xylanibacter ruminicola]SEA90808.1 Glycosyl transferase family 2 [Xylanibacter ruminicola]